MAADQQFLVVLQNALADTDIGAVGALQVNQEPPVRSAFHFTDQLRVPAGNETVVRNLDIPLVTADRKAVCANAEPLAVVVAVIDNAEESHRRPAKRTK